MIALWVLAGIFTAFILTFAVLAQVSRSMQPIGLVEGKLAPCPDSPNCISSEDEKDTKHYATPLTLPPGYSGEILATLKQSITELGGNVEDAKGPYLSATFTSIVFGFVDDLEIRTVDGASEIHIRSASRVGYNDLGVNKKRVENLKSLLARQ